MSGVIGFFLGSFLTGITMALVLGAFHLDAEEEAYRNGFEDGKWAERNGEME